jgi:uncharacterized protein (UPF0261 family)
MYHHDLSITAGLLLTIEVSAVALGGGLGLPANTHWEQLPATLPVIIFTLAYHDIAPGTYRITDVQLPESQPDNPVLNIADLMSQ